MLKIQNEKFQKDGNQHGVYLADEGESNVGVDGGAEVDAVVYAGVFQDVKLEGGAGVVGDAKAEVYVGVDVDVDAPVEVLVGEDAGVDADADAAVDVDVDVVVVTDASAEKYANVKVDVHVGVVVDVGLGVSVESGVEVSTHFFCSYTVGPLKGGNAQYILRNMFGVNLLQGHPISYNFTTFFSRNLI